MCAQGGLGICVQVLLASARARFYWLWPCCCHAQELSQQIESSLERFFRMEQLEETVKKRRRKKDAISTGHDMNPNKIMAHALDNALRGSTGLPGLVYFKPDVRPGPLKPTEVRYFHELRREHQISGTSTRRSCIMDRVTKERRYEVPRHRVNGELHRPCLHKSLDEGMIGLPMVQWLDSCAGLRGTTHEDWLTLLSHLVGLLGGVASSLRADHDSMM
jgi:hypothetical protein